MKPNTTSDKAEQEHSCHCCENPEVYLNTKTVPAALCKKAIQKAEDAGNFVLAHRAREANRLNNITTKEERVKKLVIELRKKLGLTEEPLFTVS